MLGPDIAMPIAIHDEWIDWSNDLIKDIHHVFFIDHLLYYKFWKGALIRLGDKSNAFLIWNAGLNV